MEFGLFTFAFQFPPAVKDRLQMCCTHITDTLSGGLDRPFAEGTHVQHPGTGNRITGLCRETLFFAFSHKLLLLCFPKIPVLLHLFFIDPAGSSVVIMCGYSVETVVLFAELVEGGTRNVEFDHVVSHFHKFGALSMNEIQFHFLGFFIRQSLINALIGSRHYLLYSVLYTLYLL